MKAGRKMDALIASRIFGLTIMKDALCGEVRAWRPTERSNPPNFFEGVQEPFLDYSTDIAAAWEVVNKLSRQGIEVVTCEGFSGNLSSCMLYLGAAASYPPKDTFLHLAHIEQTRLRFGELVIRVQAKTMPLAICQAALKALKGEN